MNGLELRGQVQVCIASAVLHGESLCTFFQKNCAAYPSSFGHLLFRIHITGTSNNLEILAFPPVLGTIFYEQKMLRVRLEKTNRNRGNSRDFVFARVSFLLGFQSIFYIFQYRANFFSPHPCKDPSRGGGEYQRGGGVQKFLPQGASKYTPPPPGENFFWPTNGEEGAVHNLSLDLKTNALKI